MPTLTGVNHIALATSDLDRTIRYWRDLIGLRLVGGLGRPGARQYFFELGPRSYLVFFQWDGVEPLEEKDHGYPAKGPLGFDHVALEVDGQDDLWELRDKLEAAGFWVSEPMDHGFILSIYSFDPNGIAVEFSLTVPQRDAELRRAPRLADRDPGPVALEGPAPQPGHWPEPENPTAPEDRRVYPGEGQALFGAKAKDF